MADNRPQKQQDWETGYVDRVKYLTDILESQQKAAESYATSMMSSSGTSTSPLGGVGLVSGGGGGDASKYRDMDIRGRSTLSATEINAFFERKTSSSSLFRGKGQDFIDAQNESGLNVEYLISHSCLETGWGTSRILRDKFNFFGIAAYDNSAYSSATKWDGFKGGLVGGAIWIAEHYAAKGQSTVRTMRWNNGVHQYATDPEWDIKIAGIWASLPTAANTPAPTSSNVSLGNIPIATIVNGRIIPPDVARKQNQQDLYNLLQKSGTSQMASLDTSKFHFANGEHSNIFFPHFAQIMMLIHQHATPLLGVDKLVVSSGLRTEIIAQEKQMNISKLSPHMCGVAMDIAMRGDSRFTLADCAWGLGIRAIGIGQNHVHIDCMREAHWAETADGENRIYWGPGKFSVKEPK